ncbi:hypothetical protein [Streptomyces sp. B6B3]|uniref:hypothetical protein n=1 Tax=Streptomyces sp. B6B3 TaxID=3153570 RepID=UPI00325D5BA8
MDAEAWIREYALLALRVNRQVVADAGGTVLIYRGPDAWRAGVEDEEPVPPGRLAEDAEALLDRPPFPPERARYLAAQVRALRAVAGRLAGDERPLTEYAHDCLGVPADPVPEEVFEEAHARLDRALPPGAGTLAERLHAWQAAHTLRATGVPPGPPRAWGKAGDVPGLLDLAVAECRRRTSELVALPDGDQVDCQIVSVAHFRAAGHYAGGVRSTLFVNGDLPFNLADLLYVVSHEVYPGHIAESLLKEVELVERRGRIDQRVRFMLAPSFVISEGLGLHAEEIAFPGDAAQAWLADHVLRPRGIGPDGSDLAAIHRTQNALFGAWANASLLAAEGRDDAEVAAYLTRWALLSEAETATALGSLRASGMALYVLGYFHGWRLLDAWLDAPDRADRVRRLLTEQLLPEDVTLPGQRSG